MADLFDNPESKSRGNIPAAVFNELVTRWKVPAFQVRKMTTKQAFAVMYRYRDNAEGAPARRRRLGNALMKLIAVEDFDTQALIAAVVEGLANLDSSEVAAVATVAAQLLAPPEPGGG